jgi:hypothetical protein
VEEFFEYAVQIERPGHRVQLIEFRKHHADAQALRDFEALRWGDDKVHVLTRWVTQTPWQQATNVPPAPREPEPPDCEPQWPTQAHQEPGITDVATGGLL